MTKKTKHFFKVRILLLIFSLFLAVVLALTYAAWTYEAFLNDRWQIQTTQVVTNEDGGEKILYQSDYTDMDELYDAKSQFIRDVVRDGVVLLKNERNALPLSLEKEKNVSVFGRSSTQMIQGISGGAAAIAVGRSDELPEVFSSVGLTVNPILYNFYKNADSSKYYYSYSSIVRIGEVPVGEYTAEVRNSYRQYGDAAFVVLSRSKAENSDYSLNPEAVSDGDGVHHALALQEVEREMIAEAKANFSKVIVLINSDYAMEIDELKEDSEIDAILWIGGTGYNGIYGVADVLVGKTSPSGHLADTYAVNAASSPAAQNFGDYQYTNVTEDIQAHYVVYQEGIYIGYKYYETRYEDAVLGRYHATSGKGAYGSSGAWNYADEVSYSFGYGLSYSSFSEEITDFNVNGTRASITVKVVNQGDYDGKHVVQVYAQSPYTQYDISNRVEKAAVQLIGFDKTDTLKANGGSETLTIDLDLYNLASYDYTAAKTYIMEAGTYYFAIGNGAHDALNHILAAKGKTVADGMDYNGTQDKVRTYHQSEDDFETYSVSKQTGYKITNQLEKADLNYYGSFITYLSRSDWEATWPQSQVNLTATEEMLADLKNGSSYTAIEATEEDRAKMVYDSKETAYSLVMMRGEEFESEYWDDILNQMSLYEMTRLVGVVGGSQISCESILFAGSVLRDGPAGVKATYTEGKYKNEDATMFASEVLLASTFNLDLAAAQGAMFGNDSLWLNTNAVWAPGNDIHRTPMSGRNSEYFSEDSVLAALMCKAVVVSGMTYGLIMSPKHFAFNDQETNRDGVCTFFNEQAGREIMLRAFEAPLSVALGLMSAYNRVGCVYSSACVGLMTEILRNEWGFKGYAISDAVGSRTLSRYADGPASVFAGLTAFDTTVEATYCGSSGSLNEEAIISDPVLFESMRKACHYNLYAWVNSSAMNGYSSNMQIKHVMPYYQVIMLAADCVFGALAAISLAAYLWEALRKKGESIL